MQPRRAKQSRKQSDSRSVYDSPFDQRSSNIPTFDNSFEGLRFDDSTAQSSFAQYANYSSFDQTTNPSYSNLGGKSTLHFTEMQTDQFGNGSVDVSNSAFANVDQSELRDLLKINTDTSVNPRDEERYTELTNYDSNYKKQLILQSVKDVRRHAKYLNEHDDSNEHRNYEAQTSTPILSTNAEQSRKEHEIQKLINHNANRFNI